MRVDSFRVRRCYDDAALRNLARHSRRALLQCVTRSYAHKQGVKEEYGSDWYKTMYKRLHKLDRPRKEQDEPLKIKIRHGKSKEGEPRMRIASSYGHVFMSPLSSLSLAADHRFDTNYYSDDEGMAARRIQPRAIADYEPGRSSINTHEKQMVNALWM